MRGSWSARPSFEGRGRRLADGAADRRDRCRQSQRLYPDQPDLHHRRPDRARFAAVRRGPQARRRCRHQRQPRRRQDAGAGAARGGARRCASTTRSSSSSSCSPASAASPTRRSRPRSRAARRIRAVLSQPQYAPLRLTDEVALVHGAAGGLLDTVPLELIGKFRARLAGSARSISNGGRRRSRAHRRHDRAATRRADGGAVSACGPLRAAKPAPGSERA